MCQFPRCGQREQIWGYYAQLGVIWSKFEQIRAKLPITHPSHISHISHIIWLILLNPVHNPKVHKSAANGVKSEQIVLGGKKPSRPLFSPKILFPLLPTHLQNITPLVTPHFLRFMSLAQLVTVQKNRNHVPNKKHFFDKSPPFGPPFSPLLDAPNCHLQPPAILRHMHPMSPI